MVFAGTWDIRVFRSIIVPRVGFEQLQISLAGQSLSGAVFRVLGRTFQSSLYEEIKCMEFSSVALFTMPASFSEPHRSCPTHCRYLSKGDISFIAGSFSTLKMGP